MAVVLQPLVNLLSIRPKRPPRWAARLKTCAPCACFSSACPATASLLGALFDWVLMLRLPRALAIFATLVLVLAVGTLLAVVLFNAVYEFVAKVDLYVENVEGMLYDFKKWWRRRSVGGFKLGQLIDIDALTSAIEQALRDMTFLQGLFVNGVSYVTQLVMSLILVCILWIFLVMTPPDETAAASSPSSPRIGPSPTSAAATHPAGGSPPRYPKTPHPSSSAFLGSALPAGALRPIQLTQLYLRWKAGLSLGKALVCGLIYAIVKLPLWPLFAICVFWLNWVPVFGGVVAVALPLPIALVDPSISWQAFAVLFTLPLLVQVIVDNFIDQLVMARAMTLHPVTIMGGLFTAKEMWGVTGMALSVPLLAALKAMLASTAHPYAQALAAVLEGDFKKAALMGGGRAPTAPRAKASHDGPTPWERLRVACGACCCPCYYAESDVEAARDAEHEAPRDPGSGISLLGDPVFGEAFEGLKYSGYDDEFGDEAEAETLPSLGPGRG